MKVILNWFQENLRGTGKKVLFGAQFHYYEEQKWVGAERGPVVKRMAFAFSI